MASSVWTSEQHEYSRPEQLVDSIQSPGAKWLTLNDNVLDGTYKPLPPTEQQGWVFNGINQYMMYSGSMGLTNYPVTMEAWFKVRSIGSAHTIFSLNGGSGSVYLCVIVNSAGAVRMYSRNSTDRILTTADGLVEAGKWYHVAAVYESSTSRRLYVNGNYYGTNTEGTPWFTPVRFLIGLYRTTTPQWYADAIINDVRVWSVARTQEQIQESMHFNLASDTPNLRAYYRSIFVPGVRNADMLRLPRSLTQRISADDSAAFDSIITNQAFSLQFWYKWDNSVNTNAGLDWMCPIGKGSFLDGSTFVVLIKADATTGHTLNIYCNDGVIASYSFTMDSGFHNFATTYNGSTCIIYYDGVAVVTNSSTKTIVDSTHKIRLGYHTEIADYAYPLAGNLFEVSVRSVVSTPEEVVEFMNDGSGLIGDSATVAYWPFSDGSGTTLTDKSGNNQTCTIVDATWENRYFSSPASAVDVVNSYNAVATNGPYSTLIKDRPGPQVGWWAENPVASGSTTSNMCDLMLTMGTSATIRYTGNDITGLSFPITIQATIRITSVGSRDTQNIVSLVTVGASNATSEVLGLNIAFPASTTWRPVVRIKVGANTRTATLTTALNNAALLNQTIQLTAIISSSSNVVFYVDGVNIGAVSYGGTAPATFPDDLGIVIGGSVNTEVTGVIKMIGHIQDVRVYKKALTQAETTLNSHFRLKGNESDLFLYYKLLGASATEYNFDGNYPLTKTSVTATVAGRYGKVIEVSVDPSAKAVPSILVGNSLRNEWAKSFYYQSITDTGTVTNQDVTNYTTGYTWKSSASVANVSLIRVNLREWNTASSIPMIMEFLPDFSVSTSDTLLPMLVESAGEVSNLVSSADTLSVISTETTVGITAELSLEDTLLPKLTESKAITAQLSTSDTLRPKTTETKAITAQLSRTDTLRPKLTESVGTNITAYINRADTLKVRLEDALSLRNVHTIMSADSRQVFGKVIITYTDPFLDELLSYSANQEGANTFIDQLANNLSEPSHKWLPLSSNTLDGTYHPLPSNGDLEVGWWGTELSDEDGILDTPAEITVVFSTRTISRLSLSGDSILNEFPVDFNIYMYSVSDTLLDTVNVTDNDDVHWSQDIALVTGVAKMVLEITKINKPFTVPKLLEFYTAVVETYYADTIESISLLEETGYITGSIPIGNVSSNEVDITLSNADRRFDINNTSSPLYGLIKRNRRVEPFLGVIVNEDTQEIEWYPLGTFWTTTWDIRTSMLSASLTARDRLELMRLTDFSQTVVFTNKTLYELFEIVLQDYGLTSSEYELDAALSDIVIPYAWFNKMSHREALNRLAGCAIVQVHCTKINTVRVNLFLDATPGVIATFDDDNNVYEASFPLAVTDQVNFVEVTAQKKIPSSSMTLMDIEDSFTIPAGQTVVKSYQSQYMPVLSISSVVVSSSNGDAAVDSYSVFSWGIEVTIKNEGISTETVEGIVATGMYLENGASQILTAQDDALIRNDGKIKEILSHDFIQDFSYAQGLATEILNTYKTAKFDITMYNRGNIAIRLGDRIKYHDYRQNIDTEYAVSRQTIEWNGALSATSEGKKL